MTRTGGRPAALLIFLLAAAACGGSTAAPGPLPSTDPTCVMTEAAIANEGWTHVAEGSAIPYRNNPPASGPHYPVWGRYEAFTTPLARGYWVHNLEHGAVVLLHRPDAPAAGIDLLRQTFAALPEDPACGHPRALLTPDAFLGRPFAAVAADHVLLGDCVNAPAIAQFTLARRNRAPEQVCAAGTRP